MPDEGVSRSSISRFIPLGLLVLAGLLFVAFGGLRYRSFGALAENCEGLRDFVAQGGIVAGFAFVLAYAGLVALSLPVAAFLSITSGFLLGCWLGAVTPSSARRSAPRSSSLPSGSVSRALLSAPVRACAGLRPASTRMR